MQSKKLTIWMIWNFTIRLVFNHARVSTCKRTYENHENFYKRNQSKMHFDTNRKYYNVNELLDEVQDLRDRARHIRKKRTKDRFQITFCSLIGSDNRFCCTI